MYAYIYMCNLPECSCYHIDMMNKCFSDDEFSDD